MFTLSIHTDNAAFDGDDMRPELARILRAVADRIESGNVDAYTDYAAKDVNGNTVGTFRWDDRPAVVKFSHLITFESSAYDDAVATYTDGASAGTREWVGGLFEHLRQWDMGEAVSDDVFDDAQTADGLSDRLHDVAGFTEDGDPCAADDASVYYLLQWSTGLASVSLFRRYVAGE